MSSSSHTKSLTSIACLPTREKYYSEDANAPLERIGEWYLYTTDNGIPYYFNARTKKVVWDRPYRDIIPSPQPSDHEEDEDIDESTQSNRIESIPFGNTPFPHHLNRNHSSSEDEPDDEDTSDHDINDTKKNKIDIDDYFKTDKDKEDEELQFLVTYNANIPPTKLTYPANELELLLQSKMDEFTPKLASKNIGSCTFSISPDLPEGVDFLANNGTISGFPLQCTNKTLYTITASNKHGETAINIEIQVKESENFYDEYKQNTESKKTVTFGFSAKKATLVKETKELQFETKEEAIAAFYELLANKGIRPQSTWSSIESKLRHDPRYRALKTEQERKSAFAKYKTDLIFASGNAALIYAEKERLKRIRSRFKDYLRETLNLERLEFVRSVYGKGKTKEKHIECKEDIEIDVNERMDIDGLSKEALCGDGRYHDLDDIADERRSMVVDHIQVLEYQKILEIEEEKKRKELERKQDFVMLLHQVSFAKTDPLFHAKSQFKALCQDEVFVTDERFAVFVKEDQLPKATQYFEEFCIAMEHILEADKQILKSFLRQHRHPVKHNDRVNQLVKYFGKSSRLSLIERPHLRLLFKEMIGKQQHLVKSGVIPPSVNEQYHRRQSNGSNHGVYSNNRYDRYDRNGNYSRDKDRDRGRPRGRDQDRERDREWNRERDKDKDIRKGPYSKGRALKKYYNKERNKRSSSPKQCTSSKRKQRKSRSQSSPNSNKIKDKESINKKHKAISSPSESGSTPNVITKDNGGSTPNIIKKPQHKHKPKEDGEIDDEPNHKKSSKKKKNYKKKDKKDNKTKKKDKNDKKAKKEKKENKTKKKDKKEKQHKGLKGCKYKTKEKEHKGLKCEKKTSQSQHHKPKCEKKTSQSHHHKSSPNKSKDHKNHLHHRDEKNGYKKNGDKHRSSKSSQQNKYDRWRGSDKNEADHGRWQPSNSKMNKKRERDAKRKYDALHEPPTKKQRVNDKEKYKLKSKEKDIDDTDRWQPEQHTQSYDRKYKNRKSIIIDVEQEKERDKYRSRRERMLRQKLLADVNRK